ncbi:MAG: phosphoheptose isomerase [Waddliaceae bacterium]|nr:phosphoheptose isomerase [Waddliaceae bacterium]
MNKDKLTAASYFDCLFSCLQSLKITDFCQESITIDVALRRIHRFFQKIKERKRKIALVGNGGSSAIVSHMQNDLCKCLKLRSMVFTETALLTAFTNDDGYETAFEQQTELWIDEQDLLIAVSSSGASENILRAVAAARKAHAHIVTFSGFQEENPLRNLGDLNFYIDSSSYGMVELSHAILCHMITDIAAGDQVLIQELLQRQKVEK